MSINRNQWLKMNKQINAAARNSGLKFNRSFGYFGPRVRRTKIWGLSWKHSHAFLLSVCNKLSRLPHVEYVEFRNARTTEGGYQYQPSLYIRYK